MMKKTNLNTKTLKLSLILTLWLFTFPDISNGQIKVPLEDQYLEAIENKNYQKALDIANLLLSYDSTSSEYYILKAQACFNLELYDETIKYCYSALNLEPNNPEAYFLRGRVCSQTESYGGAILFYSKALKYSADPELTFKCNLNRGIAYQKLNRYDEAYHDLSIAYDYAPASLEVLYPISEVLYSMGKTEEALYTLNKIIGYDDTYAKAYKLMGKMQYEMGNLKKAFDSYEKYLKYEPEDIEALNAMALAALDIEEYAKGMSIMNKSLALDQFRPDSYKIRALLLFKLGRDEEGCNNLFNALQLGYIEKYGYDALDIYVEHCE
jgi:tetratricopeptide (TPR) repeat protein